MFDEAAMSLRMLQILRLYVGFCVSHYSEITQIYVWNVLKLVLQIFL